MLRRSRGMHDHVRPQKTCYELGPGTFDAEQHEVLCGDLRLKLTPIQGKILRLLLDNEGRVISSEQIMTKIWHYVMPRAMYPWSKPISCNLRRRLVAACLVRKSWIRTVAGLGYMLRQPS